MRWLLCLAFVAFAAPAAAVTCEDVTFDAASYTICAVDVKTDNLRLFHRDANGAIYGQFSAIEDSVGKLAFAMNAGMYHADRSPVGLYREDRIETSGLVSRAGPGNFGLLPNGVFCFTDKDAWVHQTATFIVSARWCPNATQSGPMLVIDGELHPRFIPNGTSKYIRNGVGADPLSGVAYFAISNEPVNFHAFGRLFRDHLGVRNALYFDGKVSRLYAPALNRSDFGFQLGPIIGVLE